MDASEQATGSYKVYGKTADEWWAVYEQLAGIRYEVREHAHFMRNEWFELHMDSLWDGYRAAIREYELVSARCQVAYALHRMAYHHAGDMLNDLTT